MLEVNCTYIDTCIPDYLQDHHNRENEALLYCYPNSDIEQIIEDLLNCCEYLENTWNLDVAKVNQAVVDMVDSLSNECIYPPYQLEDDTDMYIYAYLSW